MADLRAFPALPSGSHAQPASPTDSASSIGSPRSATAPSPPSPASPPSAELVELKAMVAHQQQSLASQQQSIQALQTIIQESNTRMEQRLTEALSQFNFLRHIMPLFAPTPATAITPEDAMTMDPSHPPAAVYMQASERKSPSPSPAAPLEAQPALSQYAFSANAPNSTNSATSCMSFSSSSVANLNVYGNPPPAPLANPPHYSSTTSSLPSPHQ